MPMRRAIGFGIVTLSLWWRLGASGGAVEKSIILPPDNAMAELKPGVGVEVVRANCIACHSTDYIVRQPGRDTKQWEAEVKKMISVFGAPINDPDVKVIVQYLATAYGPPPKAPERHGKPRTAKP